MRFVVFCVCIASVLVLVSPAAQEPTILRNEADPRRLEALYQALEQNLPYVPGELLVQFEPGMEPGGRSAALSALREDIKQDQGHWIGDILHLTGLESEDAEEAAAIVGRQRGVAFAQPNYINKLSSIPNDPLFSRQWHMGAINMPQAWDLNLNAGSGVTVAVIDSGMTTFNASAVTFRLPLPPAGASFGLFSVPFARAADIDFSRVTGAREFTPTGPWTLNGQPVIFDTDGHGTHVAGTIGQQTNNNLGFSGVAHGVTLMPVKVCYGALDFVFLWGISGRRPPADTDGCDDSSVVAGIRYAVDNGARVLNISLGGTRPSPVLREGLAYAVSRGAFVTIAAGNDALEGNPTEYPASYAAGLDGVVAVGATTPQRTRARYSGFRPYVELAAPGGEGGVQGCGATDDDIWQMAPNPADLLVLPPRFDRYASVPLCGTSMASPHVAGAAALLYSQGITNPAAIEAALKRFAVDLGPAGADDEFGYGQIDVRAALLGLGLAR